MADRITVRAPAKLNLYLEVLGKRPDGYHEIRTIMQAVSLCDELDFRLRADGEVTLACSEPALPTDAQNLVVRAARMLQRRGGVRKGADVRLLKRIPMGGGLGGGSADAAVALRALCALWEMRLAEWELAELAAALGSDVPFFLMGGTALCEGRGERVSPLKCPQTMHYVLVMPPWPTSTARVYAAFETGLTKPEGGSKLPDRALENGDARLLGRCLRNDLQEAALSTDDSLRKLWARLSDLATAYGAEGALLSGSGSSFYLIVRDEQEAERTAGLVASALSMPCAAVRSIPAWEGRLSQLAV